MLLRTSDSFKQYFWAKSVWFPEGRGNLSYHWPIRAHHHLHRSRSRVKVAVAASGEEMPDDPQETFKSEVRKRLVFFSLCHEMRNE